MYVILLFALRLPLKRDKIHMVSQMAHAKNLGELFMAHPENLYNILCQLIHAFITSRIDYCNSILYGMPDTILSDLQRIQNTAARILTKCGDRNYPSINLLKKLHWLPIRQRITYKILILTFKAYHKTAPQYICDLTIPRAYNKAVRSNNSFALIQGSYYFKLTKSYHFL